MALSDALYPANPSRRNTEQQLYSRLVSLMDMNFDATNDLISILHFHLPGKQFDKITMDRNASMKRNSDAIVSKINEIIAYLEMEEDTIRMTAAPEVYQKIMAPRMILEDKLKIVRQNNTTERIFAGIIVISLTSLLQSRIDLFRLDIETSNFLSEHKVARTVTNFIPGVNLIAGAIIGAFERDEFEESISKLKETLKSFEPASTEYTKQIAKVGVLVNT